MSYREETIGACTLYLGDCREILPTLGRVDAVVTDPPYGIGIANNPVRQKHERKAWDAAPPDGAVFADLMAISDQQIIWGGNYFGLPASQCFLIWDKGQPQDFSLAMCEMAWASKKMPAKMWRQSVLSYDKEHPTQKPDALMRWCLEFLPDSNVILDPFMGSGTTLVACAKLGRRGIGIEIEPKYFDIACRRVEQALPASGPFHPATGDGSMNDPRIEAVAREIGYAWEKQPEQMREHWRLMARNYLLAADAVDPLRRVA